MKKKGIIIALIVLIAILSIVLFFILFGKSYVVTFKDKNTITEEKVKSGKRVEEKNITDDDFIGWYDEDTDEEFDFSVKINKNYTLIAKYREGFTIKFDTDGADEMESITVLEGKKIKKPKDPVKLGYKFVEWQVDGKKFDFNSRITEDMKLKAVWVESDEKFKVSFDTKGGSVIETVEVQINNTVSKPTSPTKRGYNFVEWMLEGKTYDFNEKVVKDITLEAKWEAKPKYKVSFLNDGVEVFSLNVISGERISTMPGNPSKAGYVFTGWYAGSSVVDANTRVYKNLSVNATYITQDKANLNNAINVITSSHPTMEVGGEDIARVITAKGCSISSHNVPATIERTASNYSIPVTFTATCGNESSSVQTNVIIKASPYTYTKTPNSNMLNYNVEIVGGSWNSNARLFLGNEGSFRVTSRIAVVENGKIENNPVFKLRFDNDTNTTYTVSYKG